MPANLDTTAPATTIVDGLLAAPIGRRGTWAALKSLRAGMAELREAGRSPAVHFIVALADDGRVVSGRSSDASLFLLGYRTG